MSEKDNSVRFATSEEVNESKMATVRANARGHPVRLHHQGSDEGRRCRSTPACSNAEGGRTKVGWSGPTSVERPGPLHVRIAGLCHRGHIRQRRHPRLACDRKRAQLSWAICEYYTA